MPRPVTVVTGFLGSGKSTLLNRLLASPDLANAAVIVNEFGDISIDHILVEKAVDDAVILRSGCICCTIRGDLVDTLLDLEARSARGEIPAFDRVVIETTGLADAAPVLQTLQSDFSVSGRYEIGDVVTTVDCVNALAQLERFPEARRQVAFAGIVALTKTDLVDPARAAAVVRAIRAINPAAEILTVVNGVPIEGRLRLSGAGRPLDPRAWLSADAYAPAGGGRHAAGISSFAMTLGDPVEVSRLKRWLVSLTSLRGRFLLRIKGIANIRSIDGPVIVQGVHHVLYPPVVLDAWPDADRRTRIVFITDGLPPADLETTRRYLLGPAVDTQIV
jgi:G3E family GTPase